MDGRKQEAKVIKSPMEEEKKEELHEIRLDRLFSIKKPAGIPSHTTLLY